MPAYDEITRRDFIQLAGATSIGLGVPAPARAYSEMALAGDLSVASEARKSYDLGQLKWQLCGLIPYLWSVDNYVDVRHAPDVEVGPIDALVPGSVQMALLRAGVLQDWNVGLNYRQAEWVENRDWIYQTQLPDEWLRERKLLRLRCAGLDYGGRILLNGEPIFSFNNSFIPYAVDIKPFLKPTGNLLQIWFQPPPRWLGQFGYTSEMKQWKPRFNYSWDWIIRLVQIGIWDSVTLEAVFDAEIGSLQCLTDASLEPTRGSLRLHAGVRGGEALRIALKDSGRTVREQSVAMHGEAVEVAWEDLPIELWWPNGMGRQTLYTLELQLLDGEQRLLDAKTLHIGFRHIDWRHTEGAADVAPPYLCVVNDRELFLFGVNWTLIRPNFADLREEDYRKRIAVYRDMGVNIFRVWGGGFAEKQWFYDLCDQNGILVWQEFPLSSSGLDDFPPGDAESIRSMGEIARSYIERLQHRPSQLLWCGGNELVSPFHAVTIDHHPLIVSLAEIVRDRDPGRAFLPTSPYGPPRQHWDVHGPWNLDGPVDGAWRELWRHDAAMFHSEMGAPSSSPAAMIREYSGGLPVTPGTHSNPLWNRQPWWVDWPKFAAEKGREPASLEEFVAWTQKRQSDALSLAVSELKSRFPACGGVILWMGHDCFPCTSNASIVDFSGEPKPAALALKKILRAI